MRFNAEDLSSEIPNSVLTGHSVFTTLRVLHGKAWHVDRHLSRLEAHAAALSVPFPSQLEAEIEHYLDTENFGLLRITLLPEGYLSSMRKLLIPPQEFYQEGIGEVFFSNILVDAFLGRYKTGNYLPYRLAYQAAQAAGMFEAILQDALGNLVDGSRTSLLFVQGDDFVVAKGGLEGITRRLAVEYLRRAGVGIRESFVHSSAEYQQLFLCGTGVGLIPLFPPRNSLERDLIQQFRLDDSATNFGE